MQNKITAQLVRNDFFIECKDIRNIRMRGNYSLVYVNHYGFETEWDHSEKNEFLIRFEWQAAEKNMEKIIACSRLKDHPFFHFDNHGNISLFLLHCS